MKPKKIKKIRTHLGMTQKEFGLRLGVTKLAVSQWEIGFRKPSLLTIKAIQMLKEIESGNKRDRIECLVKRRFEWLNRKFFASELEGNYHIQLSERIKKTLGRAIPSKKLIRLSASFFEKGDWEGLDNTLKHEMVHCWLYEKARPWGHTKEFKAKLDSVM